MPSHTALVGFNVYANALTASQYQWTPTGVNELDVTSLTRMLVIPGGAMKGGKEYKLQLFVSDINNPDISVETELTITTMSKDLKPKIWRAPLMQVGTVTHASQSSHMYLPYT